MPGLNTVQRFVFPLESGQGVQALEQFYDDPARSS